MGEKKADISPSQLLTAPGSRAGGLCVSYPTIFALGFKGFGWEYIHIKQVRSGQVGVRLGRFGHTYMELGLESFCRYLYPQILESSM